MDAMATAHYAAAALPPDASQKCRLLKASNCGPPPGASQCEVNDVYVAQRGQNERAVDSEVIGQGALQDRNYRPANDRAHHTLIPSPFWFQPVDRERKDAWEHYGVEEPNQ